MDKPLGDTRAVPSVLIRPIRHRVLRPGRPFETTVWTGDDDPDTAHFALYLEEEVIGAASVYHVAPPYETQPESWQLRGMAVLPEYQNKGCGGRLLNLCEEYVRARGAKLLWCNARARARSFYERHGFIVDGFPFDIPQIGPHYRMLRVFS